MGVLSRGEVSWISTYNSYNFPDAILYSNSFRSRCYFFAIIGLGYAGPFTVLFAFIATLYAMEVDPTANESGSGNMFTSMMSAAGAKQDEEGNAEGLDFMKDIMASVPGIDEATSFGEVIKSLDEYNFDLIIFDTAPTGHTLRLLNFPNILEKGLLKLIELKDKFGGMMN